MATTKNQKIYNLYKLGYNNVEIAQMYNLSRSRIAVILSTFPDYVVTKVNPAKHRKQEYELICGAYTAGWTMDRIAKKFNLSIQGINKILIKNGIEKRKQGKSKNIVPRVATTFSKVVKLN